MTGISPTNWVSEGLNEMIKLPRDLYFRAKIGLIIHQRGGKKLGWAFNPSGTQLVEEIPVKLHLTGMSRLTVQFLLPIGYLRLKWDFRVDEFNFQINSLSKYTQISIYVYDYIYIFMHIGNKQILTKWFVNYNRFLVKLSKCTVFLPTSSSQNCC